MPENPKLRRQIHYINYPSALQQARRVGRFLMKINRHGQSKILTPEEIELLFSQGLQTERERVLFSICLFSACRVAEACSLVTSDVYSLNGEVNPVLILRKANTKGKLATRNIPMLEDLRVTLSNYYPHAGKYYLFPGRYNRGHLNPDTAARFLRDACKRVELQGVSTHSFRRTALTQMSNAGIPLRVIQKISGHRNLEQLQRYLEVPSEQVKGAIASLSMLSPIGKAPFPDPKASTPMNR